MALLGAGSGVTDDPASLLALTEKKTIDDQVDAVKPVKQNEVSAAPKEDDSYATIKGFVLEGPRKQVRDATECQEACERIGTCSSFSFRQRSPPVCMLAQHKLSYNPDWDIYVRGLTPDATGKLVDSTKFHSFPGILSPSFARLLSVSVDVCAEKCADDKKCRSYNYKQQDRTCQLSNWAIKYDPEFVYYESKQRTPIDPAENQAVRDEKNRILAATKLDAQTNEKVRLKLEAKKKAIEGSTKAMAKQQADTEKELGQKATAAAKEQAEQKARSERLKEELKTATQRGEYAETVVKSRISVQTSSGERLKEKMAKNDLRRQEAAATVVKRKNEEKEAAREVREKKALSIASHEAQKTQEESDYLALRKKAFEIHAKAVEFVKEQRKELGVVMPGDAERKEEESSLLHSKQRDLKKMKSLRAKLASLKREAAARKKDFDNTITIKKTGFDAELKGVQKESRQKIVFARQDAAKLKAQAKAKKLQAENAGNQ